jgi:hypothetical protein
MNEGDTMEAEKESAGPGKLKLLGGGKYVDPSSFL